MNSSNETKVQTVMQFLNLLTLIIGLVIVSTEIGAKGEQLSDARNELNTLRQITTDLAASTIRGEVTDAHHITRLNQLSERVDRLERP